MSNLIDLLGNSVTFYFLFITGLVNGLFLKSQMTVHLVQNVKARNTVNGLTTGTGGLLINDAIDNFLKDLAKKVKPGKYTESKRYLFWQPIINIFRIYILVYASNGHILYRQAFLFG